MVSLTLLSAAVLATVITTAQAQSVFAHVIVGNTYSYAVSNWQSDISLAASAGIDAFVLNVATPLSGATTQVANAFQAANKAGNGFKLFFSFDYLGGEGPWATDDILTLLKEYSGNPAYFHYENKPFVSTFEGPTNSDVSQWSTIRSSISGGIYFVPDWTSQGPGYEMDLIDGAFNWDIWPNGPHRMTTAEDEAYESALKPAGKSYMMGVSPWFYTNLPAYDKAWVWRGDGLWYHRWQQVNEVLPEFVEIVTWNDFGESSYIGPIFEAGIPSSSGADAQPYVNGFPHQAWLETLPYQIAAYKHAFSASNAAPEVAAGDDKIVYWYRTAPASAGTTDATGNCAQSSTNTGGYQTAYPITEIMQDRIFAIALLSAPGSVSIAIDDQAPHEFGGLQAGINFVHRPFDGQTGNVTVKMSSGVVGEGVSILSEPPSGVANFNAWVGCAGGCSSTGSGGGW